MNWNLSQKGIKYRHYMATKNPRPWFNNKQSEPMTPEQVAKNEKELKILADKAMLTYAFSYQMPFILPAKLKNNYNELLKSKAANQKPN